MALFIHKHSIDPHHQNEVRTLISSFSLDHVDFTESDLRNETTAQLASIISAYPFVRDHLTTIQRQFAYNPPSPSRGTILDGRDIGTVIVPEAPLKLFITADLKTRAYRRWKELHQKGQVCMVDHVLKDLEERDNRDEHRAISPLQKAPDAVLIDTSSLTPEDVLSQVLKLVEAAKLI